MRNSQDEEDRTAISCALASTSIRPGMVYQAPGCAMNSLTEQKWL